jgi:hypothetical protein
MQHPMKSGPSRRIEDRSLMVVKSILLKDLIDGRLIENDIAFNKMDLIDDRLKMKADISRNCI